MNFHIRLFVFFICFYSLNSFALGLWSTNTSSSTGFPLSSADKICSDHVGMAVKASTASCNDSMNECYLPMTGHYAYTSCYIIKVATQPDQCLAGFKLVAADNTCKPDCDNKSGELNASWAAVCGKNCSEMKGNSAGNLYVLLSGVRNTNGNAVVVNKSDFSNQQSAGAPSCHDGCLAKASGKPISNSRGGNTYGDSTGQNPNAYALIPSTYSGEKCSPTDKSGSTSLPTDVINKHSDSPQSQNDCPPFTTFGTVNSVPSCVKNAPSPNASGVVVASPDDGTACVGDCSKWKPKDNGSGDPTGDSKSGTGTGVDGDGQQGPSGSSGGTPDKPVDAKDEEGNDVSGNNAGFGSIKQDDVYKSKYKEKSFGAIWDSKQAALFSTPFLKSLSSSMPSFVSGGSAPVYTMNFTALKLGSHSFDIDPRIWLFIKACILLTASFTARKIIWG